MIDVRVWIWFVIPLFIYPAMLFLIFVGLIYLFAILYYWFVARHRRQQEKQEQTAPLLNRSFVFHTLSFEISTNNILVLYVKLTPSDRDRLEFGQLNLQKYKISSFVMHDEQVDIVFTDSDNHLTIKHDCLAEQSYESTNDYFVHEYTFIWSSVNYRTKFCDSFNLMNTGYWYGGATQRTVYWPINKFVTKRQSMIPNDAYKNMFGNVCERYWLSSVGLALFVDPLAPLFVSMNKKHLELYSAYETPYRQRHYVSHQLQYRLLQQTNIRDLHLTIVNRYLGKPIDTPNYHMITEPIWSTWAQFKQDINTEKILNYADEIVQRKFPRSQICIDDNWTPHYGTLEFDRRKFPDPKSMIKRLKSLGFHVTLWIHPFVSCKSCRFIDYWRRGLLIKMNILSSIFDYLVERSRFLQIVYDDLLNNSSYKYFIDRMKYIHRRFFLTLPGISLWWNGFGGVLDFTNDSACDEYCSNLEQLQKIFDVDSFKFDAGEVNWLPTFGSFMNPSCQRMNEDRRTPITTPALYPYLYAQLAHRIDVTNRLQEVRIGYRSQKLPMFVRIIDKDSNWSYENGLRSLLPSIFNLSLLGYPFILPDMVGGNGYGFTITQTRLPKRELYIRWLQLNVLLPAIQFSFPPWLYNDEQVIRIAHKCLEIRQRYHSLLISTAQESVKYGMPMIRPLWFSDPYDHNAQICDSEYMLGNSLLIAPVLDQSVNELNIYLPAGDWKCIHTEKLFEGNQTHLYPVTIEDIPIFERC